MNLDQDITHNNKSRTTMREVMGTRTQGGWYSKKKKSTIQKWLKHPSGKIMSKVKAVLSSLLKSLAESMERFSRLTAEKLVFGEKVLCNNIKHM